LRIAAQKIRAFFARRSGPETLFANGVSDFAVHALKKAVFAPGTVDF
jgi:hypothetical protein